MTRTRPMGEPPPFPGSRLGKASSRRPPNSPASRNPGSALAGTRCTKIPVNGHQEVEQRRLRPTHAAAQAWGKVDTLLPAHGDPEKRPPPRHASEKRLVCRAHRQLTTQQEEDK